MMKCSYPVWMGITQLHNCQNSQIKHLKSGVIYYVVWLGLNYIQKHMCTLIQMHIKI